MSTDSIDYAVVLADLEAKRAALDAAIVAVKQLLGLEINAPALGPLSRTMAPDDIPADAFFHMTIGDAARKYLRIVKRKQSTRQIAQALVRGGLHSTAKHFTTTVYSVLDRLPDFTRVGGDWGLVEWYPGMKRGKKQKDEPSVEETDTGEAQAATAKETKKGRDTKKGKKPEKPEKPEKAEKAA